MPLPMPMRLFSFQCSAHLSRHARERFQTADRSVQERLRNLHRFRPGVHPRGNRRGEIHSTVGPREQRSREGVLDVDALPSRRHSLQQSESVGDALACRFTPCSSNQFSRCLHSLSSGPGEEQCSRTTSGQPAGYSQTTDQWRHFDTRTDAGRLRISEYDTDADAFINYSSRSSRHDRPSEHGVSIRRRRIDGPRPSAQLHLGEGAREVLQANSKQSRWRRSHHEILGLVRTSFRADAVTVCVCS